MYEQERRMLQTFCRLAYDRQLVVAADGNFSLRLPDGNILITPSGRNKGLLGPEDMIVLDPCGEQICGSGRASSESQMHCFIYRQRPDVGAVFHSHPPFATVFASIERTIPENYFVEVPLMLGTIPCAGFAMPGTGEMVKAIEDFVADTDCILLRNHGALAYGTGLETAFNRLETLEAVCKMTFCTKQAGTPVCIPPEAVKQMQSKRKKKKGV